MSECPWLFEAQTKRFEKLGLAWKKSSNGSGTTIQVLTHDMTKGCSFDLHSHLNLLSLAFDVAIQDLRMLTCAVVCAGPVSTLLSAQSLSAVR